MEWLRVGALAALSLTIAPTRPAPVYAPLPVLDLTRTGAPGRVWTRKYLSVTALEIRLNGLGAKTHANWVLFRLPFDVTQMDRVRALRFDVRSKAPTDVGALMLGSLCLKLPPSEGLPGWSRYTSNGILGTEEFDSHPVAPTEDPTILGINVTTRLANWVACGWDDGRLTDLDNWSLEVTWEER